MNQHHDYFFGITSGTFALISLADIQPYITFAASIIAVVSGIVSIRKNWKK